MTNQLQKLKTTNSFGTKFDTPRTNKINCLKFIEKDAAVLRFSKLFEFRITECFTLGLIRKAVRQIGVGGFYLNRLCDGVVLRKAYQSFQEHFVFEGFGKPFFVFRNKFQELKNNGKVTYSRRYRRCLEHKT